MITVRLENADKLVQKFQKLPDTVADKIEKSVKAEALNLLAYVKAQKLSDQILHVRTGRLRRSITARFEGSGKENFRALVGTNVEYARVHEFGFKGEVDVKSHQRTMTMAWGKLMKTPKTVTVRAHKLKMNMPERSFLRSSLTENRDRIVGNIRKAIFGAFK